MSKEKLVTIKDVQDMLDTNLEQRPSLDELHQRRENIKNVSKELSGKIFDRPLTEIEIINNPDVALVMYGPKILDTLKHKFSFSDEKLARVAKAIVPLSTHTEQKEMLKLLDKRHKKISCNSYAKKCNKNISAQ